MRKQAWFLVYTQLSLSKQTDVHVNCEEKYILFYLYIRKTESEQFHS